MANVRQNAAVVLTVILMVTLSVWNVTEFLTVALATQTRNRIKIVTELGNVMGIGIGHATARGNRATLATVNLIVSVNAIRNGTGMKATVVRIRSGNVNVNANHLAKARN